MSIKAFVQNILNKTNNEILAIINDRNILVKDSSPKNAKTVTHIYGPTFTAQVLGVLKAASASNPLLDNAYLTMAGDGLNFSDDVVQGMIEQLRVAGAFSTDQANKLKALGISYTSQSESWIGRLATDTDLNQCRQDIARDILQQNATARINKVYAAISDGEILDEQGIIAKFSE